MKTLREVVEFYDRGGVRNPYLDLRIKPLNLASDDIEALVKFMEALTGDGPRETTLAAFPGIR